MQLTAIPFQLRFRKPFVLASGTRTHTSVVYIKAVQNEITGWGEAAMPPYVKETQDSVMQFVQQLHIPVLNTLDDLNLFFEKLYQTSGNYFAKAAINAALLDWWTRKNNLSLSDFFGIEKNLPTPDCCYTITMGDDITHSIKQAADFKLLKIKAGFDGDVEFIKEIAAFSEKAICIDANQGWVNVNVALQKTEQLKSLNIAFIEQPLPVNDWQGMQNLKQHTAFTFIADESFQTIDDLKKIMDCFHGINIKLMKCGGISKAFQIVKSARQLNAKVLLGCMSESSCGIATAVAIQQLFDWVDLDGPILISNNPFAGVRYNEGKILIENNVGTGALPVESTLQSL